MNQPQWRADCQGKRDYDCDIVRLSCRYWPRGGGYTVFNTGTRTIENNEGRPHIPPHACATIIFDDGDETLARADFEGETEEEVKAMVEAWAKDAMSRAVAAVRREFAAKEADRG